MTMGHTILMALMVVEKLLMLTMSMLMLLMLIEMVMLMGLVGGKRMELGEGGGVPGEE